MGGHPAGRRQPDPEVYPDPNHFDITRVAPADHLAFSGGIHYRLGSPLARMELARALRALAMRPGTTLRGPRTFPVAIR